MIHSPDSIARAALSTYASLPKTGKPQAHEMTTLAAIIVTLPEQNESRVLGTTDPLVIALATGTKSLPAFKRAPDGSAVHDCHAEVLARRAFVRWLYDELEVLKCSDTLNSLLMYGTEDGKVVRWRPGVQLHLFISRLPCGDAAILEEPLQNKSDPSQPTQPTKRFRTGAKPSINGLPTAHDVESYSNPQAVGLVRRKPGKGEATLSVSCSDKIAKWMLLGVQGSLLSSVFKSRIYLHSITVALPASAPVRMQTAAYHALLRAFDHRIAPLRPRISGPNSNSTHHNVVPTPALSIVRVDDADLESLRLASANDLSSMTHKETSTVYCGTSLVWWAPPSWQWRVKAAKYTVSPVGNPGSSATEFDQKAPNLIKGGQSETLTGAFGCRAGRPRVGGDPVPLSSRSLLCRAALANRYLDVCVSKKSPVEGQSTAKKMTYRLLKAGDPCNSYLSDWKAARLQPSPFEGWIDKGSEDGTFNLEHNLYSA